MKIIFIFIMCMISVSCTSNKIDSEKTTRINLSNGDDNVSVFDLFSKIDIIPLETNDSSILSVIDKYTIHNDIIYIYDYHQDDIFMFNINGKFIKRLNRKGNGPGEYVRITDMNINRYTGNLEILSADGKILIYDSSNENRYLTQIKLPDDFIHSFQNLSPDLDVLFFKNVQFDALRLYSRTENKVIASTWKMPEALDSSGILPLKPFYIYNNSLFLYNGVSGETFSIDQEEPILHPHHSWDFGKYTFDIDAVKKNEDWKYYHNIYMKGSANQALGFVLCAENDKYHMTQFRYKNEDKVLFYNKKDKSIKIFHHFSEDFRIRFKLVDNNYITFVCNDKYKDEYINSKVLDKENKKRLLSINEESNPFVIRLKFK